MVPAYGAPRAARDPRLRITGVAFSNDVGRTWTDFVTIHEDLQGDVCPSEADVIRLADGRYLAMIRANAARASTGPPQATKDARGRRPSPQCCPASVPR